MAQYNNSVVTDAGVELLNKCEAGQSNMQMVAFVCGSGEYTDEEIQGIRQATGLKEQKLSFGFCSKKVDGASLRLSVNINNIGLKEGFYMREFGIYAKDMSDPDSEAILYSITLADKADYMPAENKDAPTTISLDYFTVVSNNVDIKITVDPSAFARAADLEVVRQGVATNADAIDALRQLVNGLNIPAVTNSTAATESTNMALNAVQANAAVEGTMANLIATLNSNLTNNINIPYEKITTNVIEVVAICRNNVVSIRGYVWIPESGTKETEIIKIPAEYAPRAYSICTANHLSDGVNFIGCASCTINREGSVKVIHTDKVGFVFYNFSYII